MPTQHSTVTGRFLAVPAAERVWALVVKTDGCWLWRGRHDKDGYAQFSVDGRTVRTARFLYELLREPVDSKLVVDHLCRARCCVNPYHLEVVTHAENIYRGVGVAAQNKRKTHCKRGHKLSVDNLLAHPLSLGYRACKQCARVYWTRNNRKRSEAKRAAKQR